MLIVKGGYRVVNIPMNSSGAALHSFYIKEHTENKVIKEKVGRTLFIGNVDYCGERSHHDVDAYIRLIFGIFGDIESISISEFKNDEEKNSRFAHLSFKKNSAVKAALNAPDSLYHETGKEVALTWGHADSFRKRSRTELANQFRYEFESKDELKQDVNTYMKEFEENEELAKLERERALQEVDEDGFQPVRHRKKKQRMENRRGSGLSRSRVKKKPLELQNFYRFQKREKTSHQLSELRRRFEEDKERIATMKASRKFKPF